MSQGLIQGSMREAPLPDIIQLVSQGGKSGCFVVAAEARRARIYLKAGRIVHAVSSTCEGLDALYEVALWLDGSYSFEEADEAAVPAITITKPNPTILMEMHRRMDEWQVISQKIPSLDLYPHSTLLPDETPAGVNPRQARLLTYLTGYYTAEELAALLGKPVLAVAKDLFDLVVAGHVVLKGVRSGRKPDLPEAAPAPAVPAPAPAPAPVPAPPSISTVELPLPPTVPEPMAPPAAGRLQPVPVADPIRLAKLDHFARRITQAAKTVLPAEHHDMLDRLQARASQQLLQGEGPEAVKNLALAISRGAVDAGCDGELVKALNSRLKALFAR